MNLAKRLFVASFAILLLSQITTAQTPVSGTKTVCPSGCNFTTLSRAFDTITTNGMSGAVVLELKTTYVSTSEVFPLTPPVNATSTNTITIRPEAAVASALSITSTNATTTLNLNAAKYIIFDGRNGGTGTNKYLTIANSNTGNDAPAITLQNDAVNNTFRYCTIQSRNINAAEGTVFVSTTSGTTGNDNNTIDNCSINDLSTTLPVNAIYSRGTVGKENSSNTISNCLISNFYRNATVTSSAIFADTGSTQWTISNNRIFQTTSRDPSATLSMRCIYIADGDGYTITGNTIGYSSATGTGTFTFGSPSFFRGISVLVGTGSVTNIQNNTITAISHTSNQSGTADASSPFIGIEAIQGWVNIGNQTKNVIGSLTGLTITLAHSGTTTGAAPACAIYVGGSSNDSISNNEIGGISQITTGNRRVSFAGIRNASSGNTLINNNTIGGAVSNSLIHAATTAQLFGIISTTGSVTIQNNTIRNLTHSGPNVGTDASASIIGISLNNTVTSNQIISGNTIEKLVNTNIGNSTYGVIGMRYNGPSTGTNIVDRNIIKRLSASAAGTTGFVEGLKIIAGTTTFVNNSIALGTTTSGGTITKPINIRAFYETGGVNTIYHNSVLVSGVNVLSNVSSFAFISSNTAGTRTLKNNAFVNTRSFQTDNLAVGNYAFAVDGTLSGGAITGMTANYNLLYVSGTGGYVARNPVAAGTNYTTLTDWKAVATTYEVNGVSGNPIFNSRDLLKPLSGTALTNGDATLGITTDLESLSRSIYRMGAYEQTGDYEGPTITHTALLKTVSTTDRSLTATITDITAVKAASGLQPRVYFYKNSTARQSAAGTLSSGTVTSGVWSFTLSAAAMGGLATGDTVNYFIVAQDSITTPFVTSNPEGVTASNVNTITANPPSVNRYTIVNASSNFYTICDTCDFQSLTESGAGGLFESLNANILTSDATVYVYQATDETGVNALNGEALGGYKLRIVPGIDSVITLSNSTNLGQAMIRFDAVSKLSIDGAFNSSGRWLRFINTNTTAANCYPVFSFDNSSTSDSLLSCIVESNATNAARYPVVIGQTGIQSNIVIAKNLIRGSVGTPGTIGSVIGAVLCNSVSNKKITVGGSTSADGNEITDFTTNGILFQSTGDSITISNNKIYRNMDRNGATNCISITGGLRHNISYNNIGGNATNRSGVAFTIRGSNTLNGINAVTLGTSDTSFIQYNTISNFGSANDVDATVVNAINVTGGLVKITNNTIGGGVAAYDTLRGASTLVGINLTGSATYTVDNNTIGYFNHYRTATADGMFGIQVNNASTTYNITNNTISNLKSNSNTTTTASHAIGIYIATSSTSTSHTISRNTIFAIQNKQTITDMRAAGIRLTSSSGSCQVDRNRIYDITIPNTTLNHYIWGIFVTGSANYTLSNNMVSLSPNTSTCNLFGIVVQPTGGTQSVFYNNVYIGGSASSGSAKSYAFNRNTNNPTTVVRNNIFYNERTGGTGGHFAMGVNTTTALTLSNNALVTASASTVGEFGTTAQTFSAFNTSSGQTNARNGLNTTFPSATFFSSASTGNLTSAECLTSNGGTPVSVTIDYNSNTRSGTTPDMGTNEFATISNVWTGITSSDFSVASNWCSGSVPGVNDTFTIANTSNKPQLSVNTTIHTPTLQTGSRLDLNGFQLTISGTLSGTGVIRGSTTSRLIVSGTGALGTILIDQTTPGTTNKLSMFQLNRGSSPATGSATISGVLQLVDSLTLTTGTLITGGNLTLLSTSTKTATISQVNTVNAAISGNITAQRFIQSAGRRWRFLGSPVSGTTIEDWRSEIHLTGPGTGTTVGSINSNGFDATLTNFSGIYRYDEAATGTQNQGWVTPPNTSESFTTGRGYRVFVRGPRTDGNGLLDGTITTQNAVTLDLTGTPILGNVTMPVSYTVSGGAANDGWCLLANPYASQISWNSMYDDVSARTNMSPTLYLMDAITLNAYVSYNAASDIGTLTNGIIPSGAAFFVQTTGASPALTVKESHKVSSTPGSYLKTGVQPFSIRLSSHQNEGDIFLLKPMESATPFNDLYDIPKLNNASFNISSFGVDNAKLSADCRPFDNDTITIPLYVQTSQTGKVYFDIDGIDAIPAQYSITLLDRLLSTKTSIREATSLMFDASSDTSFNSNRFTLVFAKAPATGVSSITQPKAVVTCYPNPFGSAIHIAYTQNTAPVLEAILYDLTGKIIRTFRFPATTEGVIDLDTEDVSSGMYILSVKLGTNQSPLTYRIVK